MHNNPTQLRRILLEARDLIERDSTPREERMSRLLDTALSELSGLAFPSAQREEEVVVDPTKSGRLAKIYAALHHRIRVAAGESSAVFSEAQHMRRPNPLEVLGKVATLIGEEYLELNKDDVRPSDISRHIATLYPKTNHTSGILPSLKAAGLVKHGTPWLLTDLFKELVKEANR